MQSVGWLRCGSKHAPKPLLVRNEYFPIGERLALQAPLNAFDLTDPINNNYVFQADFISHHGIATWFFLYHTEEHYSLGKWHQNRMLGRSGQDDVPASTPR